MLDGAPGHALDVHDATACATPLWSVHVTGAPVSAVAASGLKQNDVPPPVHVPSVIVMPVPPGLAAASMRAAIEDVATAITSPMTRRIDCRPFSMRQSR